MAATSARSVSAGPALRIFDSTSEERRSLTLRQAFELHCLPKLDDMRESTLSLYRTTLSHWERLTGDPPLEAIDNEVLSQFRKLRRQQKTARGDLSPNTVNINLRTLTSIFYLLAPPSPANKRGCGVLDTVPFVELLAPRKRSKRIATADELSALYQACEVATWPRDAGAKPWLLWRCLLVVLVNWGMRPSDVRSFSYDWLLSHVPESGRRDGRQWLSFTPIKTSRRKPDPIAIPLHELVEKHLDALRDAGGLKRPFQWVSRNRWVSVRKQWLAIHLAAGIPVSRKIQFGDLRKTCNTMFNDVAPGIGAVVLGHAPRGVNQVHYDDPVKRLIQAVEAFPQPAGFYRGGRQLRLF